VVFAPDTELGLRSAAALVNTARAIDGHDQLADPAALDAFATQWEWAGPRIGDDAELQAVQALRPRLAHWWSTDEDGAVELINRLLRECNALPQLVKHDHWPYHLHATDLDAPLADRMAVEAAMAMMDVIRMGELGRLQICADSQCDDVYVDLSKNRSKRFCSSACSNRTNVAAFRARRSS
jgi:predicted RNA-binding Zn ribbon-like protein